MQDQLPIVATATNVQGFQKGRSGNPKGKRPGTKNKSAIFAERIMQKEIKGITLAVVAAAVAGDLAAAKLILDRLVPVARGRRVTFPMPAIENLDDIAEAYAGLWAAVSDGTLSIEEGIQLAGILDKQSEFMRSHDLERRLKRLENDHR